jgi:parallel beta-helix repeat protein
MRKREATVCTLIFAQLLVSFTALLIVPAAAKTLIVPSPTYPTIQSALTAAKDGDIIQVSTGVYYENLDVTDAVQIIGASKDLTIIDGKGVGNVVYVESSNVKITGFTIRNGNNGIRVKSGYGAINITGNIIRNNRYGASMIADSGATTSNNVLLANSFINNSEVGISIIRGFTATISKNQISGSGFGIKLSITNSSSISLNTLSNNSYGIYIEASRGNNVLTNTETSNSYGMELFQLTSSTVRDNSIKGSTFGINMFSSDGNTILHNNVSDNPSYSIYLYESENNNVANNTLSRNRWGLYLDNSPLNTIRGNTVSYNTWGVSTFNYANRSTFYQNNFINNIVQITRDLGSPNDYYNATIQKGNYWSDYKGLDNGAGGRVAGDGIGDTLIPHQGVDWYPLMNTWPTPKHDVSILAIYESTNRAHVGQTIDFEVVVNNEGAFPETFNVTLQNNVTSIGEKRVTNLAPNTNTTVTFNWNTTGVQPGYYQISATAEPVTGEATPDLADNTMTGDIIELTIEPLVGDINNDFTVNSLDLILLNQAYGNTGGPPPSPDWNPNADLNKDNKIDMLDLYLLGKNYGKTA